MQQEQGGAVIVGIDGSAAAAQALEWAADEAERRGVPLVIAHGGHISQRGALTEDTAQAAMREICSYARDLLADALATVFESHQLVDAKTELREMHPAQLLIELSEQASLIVVGRGNEGPIARFMFGSITQRVAEHASCPVVVIAAGQRSPATRTIVVGVSDSDGGRRAMDFACTEALGRGTKVHAVRSWVEHNWAGAGFQPQAESSVGSLRDGEQALLDGRVAAARKAFPTLDITGDLSDLPAHAALDTAAAEAALLVVGCRRPDDGPLLSRLGPLASWLLHHAPCPVAIIGQPTLAAAAHEPGLSPAHPVEVPVPQSAS